MGYSGCGGNHADEDEDEDEVGRGATDTPTCDDDRLRLPCRHARWWPTGLDANGCRKSTEISCQTLRRAAAPLSDQRRGEEMRGTLIVHCELQNVQHSLFIFACWGWGVLF